MAAARWLDLLDPTADELLSALPSSLDPSVIELLAERPLSGREARPLLEVHGAYVVGVTVVARPVPEEDRVAYQEIDFVATRGFVATVRKTPADGIPWEAEPLKRASVDGGTAGEIVHRLLDAVAESYLDQLDVTYAEIDELEDNLDRWPSGRVRVRLSELRHELLHARRIVSATRVNVRRVVDGRIDLGDHALFPREVELLFADTYDTLVRGTEEIDVARELLSSVRDYHQSKITENQGEVGKKLTVVASLLLLPTFIVGVYGQNFVHMPELDWRLGYVYSWMLIAVTTIAQLAFYKWRKWI